MRLEFVTLDVFTTERFKGNPLAIVKVPKNSTLGQEQKQLIAREFNFSETVFLHERDDDYTWRIDIFTTKSELPFAGHATIGTISYIASTKKLAIRQLSLLTKAGPIAARFDSASNLAEAEIPHDVRIHRAAVSWQQIVESQPSLPNVIDGKEHGIWEKWIEGGLGESDKEPSTTFSMVSIVKGMTFILVRFRHQKILRQIEQSHRAIQLKITELDPGWAPSFVAPYFYTVSYNDGSEGFTRVEARMVDPETGEDPATGSAACALSAYFALQQGEAGKTYFFEIDQGRYIDRDSLIRVKVTLDASRKKVQRVLLSGAAVAISQGSMAV